jgi:hypothetical protein
MEGFMKRLVTVLAVVLAVGCASVGNNDHLNAAALKAIGIERVAWLSNNTEGIPAGINAVELKDMRGYVDSVDSEKGYANITYKYTGKFSTPQGDRDGTLTVQRRIYFTKNDSGVWTPSGKAEELARNTSWGQTRQAS